MKRIALLTLWLVVCEIAGAALLARVASGRPRDSHNLPGRDLPRDPGGGIDCASFVTGTVTVAPDSITWGDSVTLSWSVDIPDRCTATGITVDGLLVDGQPVDGQPVGKQGS